MLGKLTLALLLVGTPALAQEAPPADPQAGDTAEASSDPKPLPYKLKRICRPQEVVGSAIPRNVCVTKRIYLKPGEEAQASNKSEPENHSQL
jgi:hypothetical protein